MNSFDEPTFHLHTSFNQCLCPGPEGLGPDWSASSNLAVLCFLSRTSCIITDLLTKISSLLSPETSGRFSNALSGLAITGTRHSFHERIRRTKYKVMNDGILAAITD